MALQKERLSLTPNVRQPWGGPGVGLSEESFLTLDGWGMMAGVSAHRLVGCSVCSMKLSPLPWTTQQAEGRPGLGCACLMGGPRSLNRNPPVQQPRGPAAWLTGALGLVPSPVT